MAGLVYHGGALGDFLNMVPVLSCFRQQFHESTVTLLGRRSFGLLARHYRLIDNILDIDSAHYSFLFSEQPTPKVDDFFKPYTSALFFISDTSALLMHAQRQRHLTILHQNPFPAEEMHIQDYHLSLFNRTKETTPGSFAHFSSGAIQGAGSDLQSIHFPAAAIAPGSGSSLKNWPFTRFRAVASTLKRRGVHVYWIVGEAEQQFQFETTDVVVRNQDLISLSLFFKQCKCLIGNDCGIAHLAALSGCPVVSIFGPSNPSIWSPYGSSVTTIYKGVCPPCHHMKRAKPHCNRECLDAISVEEVLHHTEPFISS
jgi:ADP-heptose:LPS heptosyltransferase